MLFESYPKPDTFPAPADARSIHFYALLLGFALCPIFAQQKSPNVLFFLADDCSYRDLELYGGAAKTLISTHWLKKEWYLTVVISQRPCVRQHGIASILDCTR